MSERTDAIDRALDSEWRTTAEVVLRAGCRGTADDMVSARKHLARMARQGRIERRDERMRDSCVTRSEWRARA